MAELTTKITQEEIQKFMDGRDPQERIVNLSYSYQNDYISVFYRDKQDRKCVEEQPFYPFLWATYEACDKLCYGNRTELKELMNKFSIGVKRLSNKTPDGEVRHEFDNGYLFMFYAKIPMSYSDFLRFFRIAKNPVFSNKDKNTNLSKSARDEDKQYLTVTPQEQFLISTGKRFFKGYTDYDQLLRMSFDLETEGLDPMRHRIKLNGVRLNRAVTINGREYRNWGRIFKLTGNTEEEKDASELEMIDTFLKLIYTFKPDVITAHNGENFDWNFIIVRCQQLGTSIEEMSKKYFHGDFIYKETKESTLKLGGEIEKFYRTVVPDTIVTDSMHAVRRAQATNSSIKKADLKYISKFLGIKKSNRVYTPGKDIDKILTDKTNKYAFNNVDGDWYLYDETLHDSNTEFKKGKDGDKPFVMYKRNYLADGYEIVSGEYIINRYLLDDIWECDRVEYSYNGTDFMLAKIIPEPFSKCTTMGTAGQWKAIMMAWSYENNLAIPLPANTGAFTGGLSRLLRVGYVENVVKLDYNSLYPSIILTWGISDSTDLMKAMLHMLEYVLTTREKYKGLKKKAEKTVDMYEEKLNNGITLLKEEIDAYEEAKNDFKVNDNNQSVVKKLGNSFFGSFGSNNGSVFQWKSQKCAEQTTCTGRQCLRLMISHFHELGYEPIVGDSFTGDTPLFIKYKNTGYIDIKPIFEMVCENQINIDVLGREYDYSNKPYFVLSRNGWVNPSYIYRHKTNKDIYNVSDNKMLVDVTEDHSLFDSKKEKIKPSEITKNTKLEYYKENIEYNIMDVNFSDDIIIELAKNLALNVIDRVPYPILNGNKHVKMVFYKTFIHYQNSNVKYSKTCIAGIQFIAKSNFP